MSARRIRTGSGVVARLEGEGPPLVLLAGLGQTSDVWTSVLPRLVATRTCVLVDHRGVGASADRGPLSLEGTAEDVAEVVEQLGEPAGILGWSMGGAVALHVALSRPELVDDLVLLSTAARRSTVQQLWTDARIALVESGVEREAAELMVLPWLFSPRLLVDSTRAVAIARTNARAESVAPAVLRSQAASFTRFDTLDRLDQVEARTLVVVGADDLVTPVADSVALALGVPDAELVVLPQGGHAVVLEAPAETLAPVLTFLRARIETPSSRPDHLSRFAHL